MARDPNTLWSAVLEATARARAADALHSLDSTQHVLNDDGVRFVVRELTRAAREKLSAKRRTADDSNRDPFLPYDPNLFVANLSATHVALLNKFNLSPHHIVIATREFVSQETLLDANDFDAIASCLAEIDGLMFYNGGAIAGASQSHKHLQMLPLPLSHDGLPTPIDAALTCVRECSGAVAVPALAFRHAFAWNPAIDARTLARNCETLLREIGVQAIERDGERYQSAPWNLLVTRRWMLVAPRTKADVNRVSINAVAFAGSLFVHDDAQLATVKRMGSMKLLRAVTE